jgi:hypothetical protein
MKVMLKCGRLLTGRLLLGFDVTVTTAAVQ